MQPTSPAHSSTRPKARRQDYYRYKLIEFVHVHDQVKQRTLLNLGNFFDLERELWPELCSRIEQLLQGQQELLTSFANDKIEPQAQQIYARLLLAKKHLSDDGKEAFLTCRSEPRASKEKAMNERFRQNFENAFKSLQTV